MLSNTPYRKALEPQSYSKRLNAARESANDREGPEFIYCNNTRADRMP